MQLGGTIATPQFINCDASSNMALQSVLPVGDDTSDNVFIQTLDAFGRTVDSYGYINWAGDNGDECAWVDDSYAKVEGVDFAPGQGLWITTNSGAEQSVQTAGAVSTSDVEVELRFGGTATGNPFPLSLDLQEILPTGNDTSDNVFIQTLDAFGRTVNSYGWINWAGDNGDECAWVDDSYAIVEGVSFAAGEGLWIMTNSSEKQFILFPAPEL